MRKINVLMIAAMMVGILTSCGHQLDASEVKREVLDFDKGLFAGISWGDSWEDIKKEKGDYWTIREDYDADLGSSFIQLRKEWNGVDDMMFISFDLDENKNVKRMEFSLHASSANKLQTTLLYSEFSSHLTNNFTQTSSGEYPSWDATFNGVTRSIGSFMNDSEDYSSFSYYSEYVN